ncbi:hypothetical protein ABZX51_009745 [Aspergillus tubingensis]
MRFRDGMWLVDPSKSLQYAEDIYSINASPDNRSLNLLCPTRHIFSRGNTLNLSTLHINLESHFDGVISLEVQHWLGARKGTPDFELFPDGEGPKLSEERIGISKSERGTTLKSGALSVTVSPDQHDFSIRFHSSDDYDREITSLLNRSVGLAYDPPISNGKQVEDLVQGQSGSRKHYIFTQTELDIGESVHGLGERFGPFNRLGQHVKIWNEDGGTSSDQAYKNVSFWMSSKGYGVFIDTPEKVDLEIGSERCCRVQTSVEGQRLKWYIIYGPSPKEVLTKYSVLTGRAPMVPAWSFGLWLTTSFTTNYDEATVTDFLQQMSDRSIPVEVFHYDSFWMRAFHWCDFVFSPDHFPDPKGSIARIKHAGLTNKVCVWINPYLGQASPVFLEAAEKGYLLKRTNGDVWQWDLWQTGMGLVDFTNPEAARWYEGCLERLFDVGIDSIKTDFGERIPTKGVKWHDESVDPARMHNYYAFIYNKIVYNALTRRYGDGQAVLFARSACAGVQRFPLCWGGDCESTPAALAESVRGGLSIGLSSFSFWSCDIGGFEGTPPPWIYKRWVAFGLLCSHSRLHGSDSYRVPWLIDNDDAGPQGSTAVLRTFVRLKRRLMPYLYTQALHSTRMGWPLSLRATALEFPHDPTAWAACDRQFFVGENLLVAPVFTEHGDVEFYLPEGQWTSLWDEKKVVSGPGWRREKHGFGTLPIYVREGAVIVMGKEQGEGGFAYDWCEAPEVRLYQTKQGDCATVVDASGKEVGTLTVQDDGSLKGLECFRGDVTVRRIK